MDAVPRYEIFFVCFLFLCILQPVYSLLMPEARATVETVAPYSPEYTDFLHNLGITTRFQVEVRLKFFSSLKFLSATISYETRKNS
jgi:hypothetical protein